MRRGFSLIELPIVIAIILVIITVAVPPYQRAQMLAREMGTTPSPFGNSGRRIPARQALLPRG